MHADVYRAAVALDDFVLLYRVFCDLIVYFLRVPLDLRFPTAAKKNPMKPNAIITQKICPSIFMIFRSPASLSRFSGSLPDRALAAVRASVHQEQRLISKFEASH
jgi:hypothetical protein